MTTISSSQLNARLDGRMPAWIFAAVSGTHCSAPVELMRDAFVKGAFPLFDAESWFPMLEGRPPFCTSSCTLPFAARRMLESFKGKSFLVNVQREGNSSGCGKGAKGGLKPEL